MTEARLIELELICAAHQGHRSSALILECVADIRRLQSRSAKRSGFVPPSVEDVEAVFAAGKVFRNGTAAAQAAAFCDFYASKGWLVGRARMTDWKAAARGWERRQAEKAAPVLARQDAQPRL